MNYNHDTYGALHRPMTDLIQARAYEVYEARGRVPNHAVDDWLLAEHEVRNHLGIDFDYRSEVSFTHLSSREEINYYRNTDRNLRGSLLERLKARAYEIYEERGCTPGHALDDWLAAEHDLRIHPWFHPGSHWAKISYVLSRDQDIYTEAADSPSHEFLIESIKARAHEIYLARGAEPGHALDDWLTAEHEVREELGWA